MPEFNLKNFLTGVVLLGLVVGGYFLTGLISKHAFAFFNFFSSLATGIYVVYYLHTNEFLKDFTANEKWLVSAAIFSQLSVITYLFMPLAYGTAIFFTALIINALPGIVMYKFIKPWFEDVAAAQNAAVPSWLTTLAAILPGVVLFGVLLWANITAGLISWAITVSPWIVFGLGVLWLGKSYKQVCELIGNALASFQKA